MNNKFSQPFLIEDFFGNENCKHFYKNLPKPLNSSSAIFTLYGRNALYQAGKIIKSVSDRKTFLVPSYSCGDEISAITSAGFLAEVYDVDPSSLQIDAVDLIKKITHETAGVLITHYFGFPQKDIMAIQNLCGDRNIFLIEDCAHSLGGKYKDIPLGTFGDLSIFSLRKFYPIPHGGALIINNEHLRFSKDSLMSPASEAVAKDLFIFLGYREGMFTPGVSLNKILNQKDSDPHGPRLEQFGGYNLELSKIAKYLILKSKINLNKRKENYLYYLQFFRKNAIKNIRPLFSYIQEGVVPLFFPLIVANSEEFYLKMLNKDIIIAQPFWSHLHNGVDWNLYPEVAKLKTRVLVLPVSHKIEEKYLKDLLEI